MARSPAWTAHVKRLRPLLDARADGICELCGRPLDYDAPPRSSDYPSVDHVVPLHAGGTELPGVDDLRLVHHGCNTARGNRTRGRPSLPALSPAVELEYAAEPRALVARPLSAEHSFATSGPSLVDSHPALFDADDLTSIAHETANGKKNSRGSESEFFYGEMTRPKSVRSDSPQIAPIRRQTSELVPPRLETPRPASVTGSYGPEAAAWIRQYLGDELRPWQHYALQRMLEHRDDGSLRWRRVILTVSRQSGKSILCRALCGWRLGAADIFGEPQEVLHVANIRLTAQRVMMPAARTLERTLGARVRRAQGQEAILLSDGSAWRLAASNLDGGVGSSVSLAFVDEAWRIERQVVDGSIAPTMLERESPQLALVSTAGDGGSRLLLEDRDKAIGQLTEPDLARTLLLEWSAPPDCDPSDLEAWRLASPHWTPNRIEALEQARATSDEMEFRRQYLNQWVLAARSWIGPAQWAAAARPAEQLPAAPAGTLAVNDQDGRLGPCGYVLAVLDGDTVHVQGRAFPSRRALWEELEQLTRSRRGMLLLYPANFERHVARLAGVQRAKVGTAEQRTGYGPTLAAICDGRFHHDGGDELTRQVLTATPVTIPDAGTALNTRRSPGPIFLARAMVWAVGSELRPDRRTRPLIVAG